MSQTILQEEVTILFSGDSGDGIQLTGSQFTDTAAFIGNDVSTFPNFPAEIRAPQGTLAGVSGFQLHFGSIEINTLIANVDGFDVKNLNLAKIPVDKNPIYDGSLSDFKLISFDVTKLTKQTLEGSGLGTKEIDRCKNMFILGLLYWMLNLKLPLKRVGYWLTTPRLSRKWWMS